MISEFHLSLYSCLISRLLQHDCSTVGHHLIHCLAASCGEFTAVESGHDNGIGTRCGCLGDHILHGRIAVGRYEFGIPALMPSEHRPNASQGIA